MEGRETEPSVAKERVEPRDKVRKQELILWNALNTAEGTAKRVDEGKENAGISQRQAAYGSRVM